MRFPEFLLSDDNPAVRLFCSGSQGTHQGYAGYYTEVGFSLVTVVNLRGCQANNDASSGENSVEGRTFPGLTFTRMERFKKPTFHHICTLPLHTSTDHSHAMNFEYQSDSDLCYYCQVF